MFGLFRRWNHIQKYIRRTRKIFEDVFNRLIRTNLRFKPMKCPTTQHETVAGPQEQNRNQQFFRVIFLFHTVG